LAWGIYFVSAGSNSTTLDEGIVIADKVVDEHGLRVIVNVIVEVSLVTEG
jgi:hypothetical protein